MFATILLRHERHARCVTQATDTTGAFSDDANRANRSKEAGMSKVRIGKAAVAIGVSWAALTGLVLSTS